MVQHAASTSDAFRRIRQSFQPHRRDHPIARLAAAIAPMANPIQSALDLRQLARLKVEHLRAQFSLLGGDCCINFIAD